MLDTYTEKTITIKSYYNWWKLQKVPTHRISYLEWGDINNDKVIVCAHGLSRNAHDFDKLAASLSKYFRVISFDIVGRGKSDWFQHKKYYNYFVYYYDCIKLFKLLNIKQVSWIGSSMGGVIGMIIYSLKPYYIKNLILNDIGAKINNVPLQKINDKIRSNLIFNNTKEAELFLRQKFANVNIQEQEDWDRMLRFNFQKYLNNSLKVHYDPQIIATNDIKGKGSLLPFLWYRIKCPVLLIHGSKSTILTKEIINYMKQIRNFDLYTVQNVGHAPALLSHQEISTIQNWLIQNY